MLELRHIEKRYQYHKVLHDISLTLPDVGMIGIVGASGCGKSTLLHIMGGIDRDFQGDLLFLGESVKGHLSKYRRKYVNFIFQQLHLIMWLKSYDNIHLSYFFKKHSIKQKDIPFQRQSMTSLSLGQRQRIGFLRACISTKKILLCDEPTGALDCHHAVEIMEMLKQESKTKLVVIVSHNMKLIEQYCDEIYYMQDGRIYQHDIKSQQYQELMLTCSKKRIYFSHLKLSWASLMAYKKRTIQLILGLSLSMMCILLTLTMSHTLEKEVNRYISSLIPPSSITVKLSQTSTKNQFITKVKGINRIHWFLDEFELLGIGFVEKRYQESETLFISDDSAPYQHLSLKYGHYPKEQYDILLSLSTARHLCPQGSLKQLLNKKIFAWYKYQNKVFSISYRVVGMTCQKTSLDMIYQKENAYIDLLREKKISQSYTHQYGIIYIDSSYSRTTILKKLLYQYPQCQFVETGLSTQKNANQMIERVKYVLYLFSSLAIISALFLISEVMFLNMLQNKKDYAIMMCFGASFKNLFYMMLNEILFIVIIAMSVVLVLYLQFIYVFNHIVKEVLLNEVIVLSFDYQLVGIVFILCIMLVLISQLFPMIAILKLNTVKALKG